MKTLNKLIQRFLIFVSPVVLATMIWGTYQSDTDIRRTGSIAIKMLWEVMSWSLMLWFLLLFVFMILLVFRKDTQESTVKYLAGLKERDEREEIIMGLAAKRSFTATAGLLIFLLFLSCFTLTIAKIPPNQTVDGKKSSLSLGFHFTGTENRESIFPEGQIIYEHHDLPLSKSAILLLVLLWQLATFRIRARRELGRA